MYIDDKFKYKYTQLDKTDMEEDMGEEQLEDVARYHSNINNVEVPIIDIDTFLELSYKEEIKEVPRYHSNIDNVECPKILDIKEIIDIITVDIAENKLICGYANCRHRCKNCLFDKTTPEAKIEQMRAIIHYYDNQPSDSDKQYDDTGNEV